MKYEISEKANEDIENIWLFTYENWSQEQADRYYNLIMDEIEFISENFESGNIKRLFKKRISFDKSKITYYIL